MEITKRMSINCKLCTVKLKLMKPINKFHSLRWSFTMAQRWKTVRYWSYHWKYKGMRKKQRLYWGRANTHVSWLDFKACIWRGVWYRG